MKREMNMKQQDSLIQPPVGLQALIDQQPDLVDRIFEYLLEQMPELAGGKPALVRVEQALRREFGGMEVYIPVQSTVERAETVKEVLRRYNFRNATTVARELGISRASVYRILKQAGR